MTISTTNTVAGPFNGNDVATAFPFTDVKVLDNSDLIITLTDTSSVETTLVESVDYTLVLNSDQDNSPGGTITYPVSGDPLATGEKLTGKRNTTTTQGMDLTNQGSYNPEVVESSADKAIMLVQELQEELVRSLKLPIAEAGTDLQLPALSDRLSKFLAFDASGDPISALSTGSAVVSTFMQTVLDDTTAFKSIGTLKSSYVVTDKAEAAALTLVSADAGRKIFIDSDDGGEFTIEYNAAPATYADNGGSYCGTEFIPNGGDGTIGLVRKYTGWIIAEWFGVVGDSSTNGNTAVTNALTYASTVVGANGAGNGASVFFKSGGYVMDNITWPQHVNIIGEETRLVTFFFGGTEAANSTILTGDGQSFARITGVSLIGYTPTGSDLAENLIRFEDGALDLNHTIGDVALKGCKYNAIHQEAGQVVNLHIDRIRFDAVGGYGIRLKTFLGHESRPVSINQFTLDNNNSSLPSPYDVEARWGLGLLRVIDGGHNTSVGTIKVSNGRLEKNVKYKNTTYGDYTTGETISSIALEANATAGAGQYKLSLDNVIVTGTGNVETGEALATCSGYTSSSGATVNAENCSMAVSDAFIYVDNYLSELNLPNSVVSMSVKTVFEKSVVRAYRSSDQTGIATGGLPKIVNFNVESIDSLSEFDITTNIGRFTPTRAGWYRVSTQVKFDAGIDVTFGILYLIKNGTNIVNTTHNFSGIGTASIPLNDIVYLDGDTDYLEIGVYHNTGANRALKSTDTFVSYERILE